MECSIEAKKLRDKAQGTYVISINNSVLSIHGRGPWNWEAAQCFDWDVKQVLADNNNITGIILTLEGESFASKDTQKVIWKTIRWLVEQDILLPNAVVFRDKNTASVFSPILTVLYTGTSIPFSIFDCEKEARIWIKALDFQSKMTKKVIY